MYSIIDTNHDVSTHLGAIGRAGIKTVIRYISTATSREKCIKPAEARNIRAAAMRLGLVFEVYGGVDGFSHADINAATGAAHGKFAKAWAGSVGAPSDAVIYFAIDTDVTAKQVTGLVLPYLTAAKIALEARFRMGAYGCGAVCAAALDHGIAARTWLSNAMGWTGSKAFRASQRWALLQHLPQKTAGIDSDPDESNGEFGDFVPFSNGAKVA